MSGKLFQAATIQSLMLGNYYGFVPLSELLSRADIGMGTLDGLDGEMILLDGIVYKAQADGTIVTPPADALSPFCCGARFTADHTARIRNAGSFAELGDALTAAFPENERNLFHFVKLTGRFAVANLRSVDKQPAPYVAFESALAVRQKKFTLENVDGTAVALCCPDYMDRVNVAGWHMHFITADRTIGGHILGVSVEDATAEICTLDSFEMALPRNELFGELQLTKVSNASVAKAESK